MKFSALILATAIAIGGLAGVAAADPWKEESGHGRWHERYEYDDDWRPRRERRERHSYKEEFYSRGCKVEREWKDGEYKEEVKCRRGRRPSAYFYRY